MADRTCPECGTQWWGTPTIGNEGPGVGPDRSKCRICGCVWTSDGTIVIPGEPNGGGLEANLQDED